MITRLLCWLGVHEAACAYNPYLREWQCHCLRCGEEWTEAPRQYGH